MSYDIVSIGAATEDIFFFSDRFRIRSLDKAWGRQDHRKKIEDQNLLLPWKEKFTVEGLERRLGGGAFNASVAFSRLGLKSAFFGRVGRDAAGQAVENFLEKEGVSTEFLVADPKVKTSTSALLSKGGERTIVMYRGTNDNLLETNLDWDKILDCRWLLLTDLAGTNNDLLFEVIRQIKGRKGPTLNLSGEKDCPQGSDPRRVKLAYVPGQRELELGKRGLKPVLAKSEILLCNQYEAGKILGEDLSVEEMLREFRGLGVGIPVITLGAEGSTAYDGKKIYQQKATPEVEVVDVTGAGDAFSATFTAGIILGRSIPESLLLAAKNASSVIIEIGGTAGLLSLDKLEL